jgi:hypothetical protein
MYLEIDRASLFYQYNRFSFPLEHRITQVSIYWSSFESVYEMKTYWKKFICTSPDTPIMIHRANIRTISLHYDIEIFEESFPNDRYWAILNANMPSLQHLALRLTLSRRLTTRILGTDYSLNAGYEKVLEFLRNLRLQLESSKGLQEFKGPEETLHTGTMDDGSKDRLSSLRFYF